VSYITENRPWLEGFNDYYGREIAPIVDDIAAARALAAKEVWRRTLILSAVAVPVIVALFVFIEPQAAIFGLFAAGAGYQFYARKPAREFSDLYKQDVVHSLGRFFKLAYDPSPPDFSLHHYKSMKLIPSHDKSSFEDRLSGTYEQVDMDFLEAHLQEWQQSGKSRRLVTVFRGALISVSFPKPFNGRTRVNTDRTRLGNFFAGTFSADDRVRLEDPVFEDKFEVYSSDQVEARYILTPDFMERFLRLNAKLGGKLQAGFEHNQMLISCHGGENRFEGGSLNQKGDPHAPIVQTVEELKALFDLIETLNLTSQTRAS
jgi:hypothetical protein